MKQIFSIIFMISFFIGCGEENMREELYGTKDKVKLLETTDFQKRESTNKNDDIKENGTKKIYIEKKDEVVNDNNTLNSVESKSSYTTGSSSPNRQTNSSSSIENDTDTADDESGSKENNMPPMPPAHMMNIY
ncbi:MAG: hypothetical protein U9R37_02955 [Campylobacterota bacterium]|nr:hypothetical protein [Campylobacterota bacterium]